MNMKQYLLAMLLCSALPIFSQNYEGLNRKELQLDAGLARFTSGDIWGFQIKNAVKLPIGKNFSVKPSLSFSYGTGKMGLTDQRNPLLTYQAYNHPGPSLTVGSGYRKQFDDGLVRFNAHLEKSMYLISDVMFTYGLYSARRAIEFGVGPSLAYNDIMYYGYSSPGIFDSPILEPKEVHIIGGVFHRVLDAGLAVSFRYGYNLTENLSIGISTNYNRWFSTSDQLLTGSVSVGIRLPTKE